jgi:hypothetical protein
MAKQNQATRGQNQGQQNRGREITQRESRRSATGRSFSENDEQSSKGMESRDQAEEARRASDQGGAEQNQGGRGQSQGRQGGSQQGQRQGQGGESGLSGHGREHGEHPVSDLEFDFITVLQNKAEAVNAYDKYMRDAEEAGSEECVAFFRRLHEEDTRHAQEARRHLDMIFRGEMGQRQGQARGR